MIELALHPHPDFPSPAIQSITVAVERHADTRLDLEFTISGAIEDVLWPEWRGVRQADDLWRHSCVEAFVAPDGGSNYIEFNFTTSGEWAAYAFDAYRAGMRPIDGALRTGGREAGGEVMQLRRSVVLRDLNDVDEWLLGLSAIIEMKDGGNSYWALAHAPGPPDFHNRDCFVATLSAPARP